MKRTASHLFDIFALVLAIVFIVTRLKHEIKDEGGSKQTSRSSSAPLHADETVHKAESFFARNSVPTAAFASKAQQLIELKNRWLRIKPHIPGSNDDNDTAYRRKLSIESARMLLCSGEAIELVQFLEDKEILNSVEIEIEYLFGSDLADELRHMLVSLPDEASTGGTNYREEWSGPAGKGCPPEKFAEFCSALKSPGCVQEALFGYNVALAKTDSIGALTSTLDQIEKGGISRNLSSSVTRLIKALPSDTDFAKIWTILPPDDFEKPRSPFRGIESTLIRTWSEIDPVATANYLMAHPNKFAGGDIVDPVGEVLRKDLTKGIEWIQTFPDGPFFDTAAGMAVSHLRNRRNPTEANALAAQIGDPEKRKSNMAAALLPPERYTETQ